MMGQIYSTAEFLGRSRQNTGTFGGDLPNIEQTVAPARFCCLSYQNRSKVYETLQELLNLSINSEENPKAFKELKSLFLK